MDVVHPTLADLTPEELQAHGRWLRRLALRLVADEATADDLAQEAWLRLAARRGGPVADLRAFLARTVQRLAWRRSATERARPERERSAARPEEVPSPAALEQALDVQRLLLEELRALAEPYRTVLLLRWFQGWTPTEIARRRGQPPATVRVQHARALELLRARLDRRAGGREAWALVLLRLPRARDAALLGTTGLVTGGIVMSAALKTAVAAGLTLAAAGIWWWWPGTPSAAGPERPTAVADAGRRPILESPASLTEPVVPASSSREVVPDTAPSGQTTAAAPAAGVPLLLLDEDTEEPVPHYAIALDPDRPEDCIRTDEDGRTSIEAEWVRQGRTLFAIDDPRLDKWVQTQHLVLPSDSDGEIVSRISVGPTYRLHLIDPPPPGAELELRLHTGESPAPQAGHPYTLLRKGPLPWARFGRRISPGDLGPAPWGPPWGLTLFDRHGLWRAFGRVDSVRGIVDPPVEMRGEQLGALRVAVRVDGGPIDADVQVGARPLADPFGWRYVRLMPADSPQTDRNAVDGRALLGHLEPGAYEATAFSPVLGTLRREVQVERGEVTELAFDFSAGAELHSLRVVVRSQSGRLSEELLGEVWPTAERDGERLFGRPLLSSGETGSSGAVFSIDHMTNGTWEVRLQNANHLPPFEGGVTRQVEAGAGEIVFTCLDADTRPLLTATLRLVDARTGEPVVDRAMVMTCVGNGWPSLPGPDGQGLVEVGPIRQGTPFAWVAFADGFSPVLDLDAVLPLEQEQPLEVRLERGWGIPVVVGTSDGSPLEGATVWVDGRAAGTTDAHGLVVLSGDAAPRWLETRYRDWRMASPDMDRATRAIPIHPFRPLWISMVPKRR